MRRICERCGARTRTITQYERHALICEPGAIAIGAPTDAPDLPPAAEAQIDAPPIEPMPPMPEFDSPNESNPAPAPEIMDVGIPAFTTTSLAAIYKMAFEAAADMAGVGDAGKLTDGEANLIAALSVDWLNRQLAVSGMDANNAQMMAAVGIIIVTKARVYYVAIRDKRNTRRIKDAPVATPAPEQSQGEWEEWE